MSTYRNPMDILTKGRTLPEGYDGWAIKSTKAGGSTRNGYVWPGPGEVAEAAGPFTRGGAYPTEDGDGICIATSYAGMATGGHTAATMLLVAYRDEDGLGAGGGKLRVTQCLVVERIDGEDAVRQLMSGASLRGANLRGANLRYAALRYVDLEGANLRYVDLEGANLRYANLRYANLRYANLRGADLRGADLRGANLSGADLNYANLSGADLIGAALPEGWTISEVS